MILEISEDNQLVKMLLSGIPVEYHEKVINRLPEIMGLVEYNTTRLSHMLSSQMGYGPIEANILAQQIAMKPVLYVKLVEGLIPELQEKEKKKEQIFTDLAPVNLVYLCDQYFDNFNFLSEMRMALSNPRSNFVDLLNQFPYICDAENIQEVQAIFHERKQRVQQNIDFNTQFEKYLDEAGEELVDFPTYYREELEDEDSYLNTTFLAEFNRTYRNSHPASLSQLRHGVADILTGEQMIIISGESKKVSLEGFLYVGQLNTIQNPLVVNPYVLIQQMQADMSLLNQGLLMITQLISMTQTQDDSPINMTIVSIDQEIPNIRIFEIIRKLCGIIRILDDIGDVQDDSRKGVPNFFTGSSADALIAYQGSLMTLSGLQFKNINIENLEEVKNYLLDELAGIRNVLSDVHLDDQQDLLVKIFLAIMTGGVINASINDQMISTLFAANKA